MSISKVAAVSGSKGPNVLAALRENFGEDKGVLVLFTSIEWLAHDMNHLEGLRWLSLSNNMLLIGTI